MNNKSIFSLDPGDIFMLDREKFKFERINKRKIPGGMCYVAETTVLDAHPSRLNNQSWFQRNYEVEVLKDE